MSATKLPPKAENFQITTSQIVFCRPLFSFKFGAVQQRKHLRMEVNTPISTAPKTTDSLVMRGWATS